MMMMMMGRGLQPARISHYQQQWVNGRVWAVRIRGGRSNARLVQSYIICNGFNLLTIPPNRKRNCRHYASHDAAAGVGDEEEGRKLRMALSRKTSSIAGQDGRLAGQSVCKRVHPASGQAHSVLHLFSSPPRSDPTPHRI